MAPPGVVSHEVEAPRRTTTGREVRVRPQARSAPGVAVGEVGAVGVRAESTAGRR